MRRPKNPHLEFGFYLPERQDADGIALFVQTLIRCGSKFTGDVVVCREPAARGKPFPATTDCEAVEELRLDLPSLLEILADVDTRVNEICLHSPPGGAKDGVEIATYSQVSQKASRVDHHPLALLTGGSVFAGDFPEKQPGRAKKAGKGAYERFLYLVAELKPGYANLSFESGLECPADLRRDPRSYSFSNFFVNRKYVGEGILDRIRKLSAAAYLENTPGPALTMSLFR